MTRLRRLAVRPSVALFALLIGVYAYFYQAGGWNQNSRFDLVRAVVEDHALTIDRFEKNTGDDSVRAGHWYCDKAPGASLLCIPPYAVVYVAAGKPNPVSPSLLAWGAWLSIVVSVGVPSAIAGAFLMRLARRMGLRPTGAVVVALGWALASMGLPYATLLYGNQIAAATTIIAFTLFFEVRHGDPATPQRMFAAGALLGLACASEYPAALIAMPVAVYGLFAAGLRPSLWAIVGGAIPIVALLAYHKAAFGSPFAFPYDYSVWKEPHTGWFMGIGKPVPGALRNILIGDYRGLLSTTPWFVFAVPGAFAYGRRRIPGISTCVLVVLLFLWLNCSIPPWHGGWAAGPRYLVPMLPFAAVLAGGAVRELELKLIEGSRYERIGVLAAAAGLGGLMLFSAANMFAATAVKPEISTAWKNPYAEFVWPNFRAGLLSISTQSIDMVDNPAGAPRQAWNLGMKCGLDGLASLVPLFLWIAACGAWLVWTLRSAREPLVERE